MDFNTVDIENINFNRPSITTNRKYISEAKYEVEGNFPEDIEVLTPHLLAKTPIQTTERKCYLTLRLNKTNRDFFKFLTGLEEHSKAAILENTLSWFGKDLPIDVIDDYHNQFVKIASAEDPSIKVQIPYDKETDEIQIPIVTDKGANVNQTTIFEGTIVKAQLRYVGIKFYKQQFASEWYATKLVVYDNYEPDDGEDDFDFRDNDDMLSLYSEQPPSVAPTDLTTETNIEVKVSKVSDDPDEPINEPTSSSEGTTSNELADTKAEDVKVNMVSDSDVTSVQDTAEKLVTTTNGEKYSKDQLMPEELMPTQELEPTPEPESVATPVRKHKSKLTRPKRRRIRMPNGKYRVIS